MNRYIQLRNEYLSACDRWDDRTASTLRDALIEEFNYPQNEEYMCFSCMGRFQGLPYKREVSLYPRDYVSYCQDCSALIQAQRAKEKPSAPMSTEIWTDDNWVF